MPIVKAANFIEAYRAKAASEDINELSGRTGRPDLTAFVSANIVRKLRPANTYTLVDIGCGDGSALVSASKYISPWLGRLVGVLPTEEEAIRLRSHLLRRAPFVTIVQGDALQTGLPDSCADNVICNGVLVLLESETLVDRSIREIARVAKPGATVFVGEVLAEDELACRNYGDSIPAWLRWVLVNQGPHAFLVRAHTVLKSLVSREPFVIYPKKLFWMQPEEFIRKLISHGFRLVEYYPHPELDITGNLTESRTRFDYVIEKLP